MIINFNKVNDNLYRGGAPSIKDILYLKNIGISKIVSLDEASGKRIDRAAKMLGIKHIMLPIDIAKKSTLLRFISRDITDILSDNGSKTFVHCQWGRDRTGLAIALYRCEHDHWSAEDAIKEAKSFGFGIGVDPKILNTYIKLIHQAANKDINNADIVENAREQPFKDYVSGPGSQPSWSPYEDYRVKYYPYSKMYNNTTEEYQFP